jgi:hypothetical protein
MRLIRTSRGMLCVQVGRIAFGTIGALGRDGAFDNDGRFHPFSVNYEQTLGPSCVTPDAHGNGFLNVASFGVPSSLSYRAGRNQGPAPELRDVYYGLLGPEATSITYESASGRPVTIPTVGDDGAYLLVFPYAGGRAHPGVRFGGGGTGFSYNSGLFPGAIRAVHYRDARSCTLPAPTRSNQNASCRPVGYVSPSRSLPSAAAVASPVRVEFEFSKFYCWQLPRGDVVVPCPGRIPPGFQRIPAQPSVLAVISFVSRVAITNGQRYYYIQTTAPPTPDPRYANGGQCHGRELSGSNFLQTSSDYRAGQVVTDYDLENLACGGPVHGNVQLVSTNRPTPPGSTPPGAGQSVREVGHFSFTVP